LLIIFIIKTIKTLNKTTKRKISTYSFLAMFYGIKNGLYFVENVMAKILGRKNIHAIKWSRQTKQLEVLLPKKK